MTDTMRHPVGWPEDRFADVCGRRLRYWDVGSGVPIVIESGLGTAVPNWSHIIGDLATRGRVIAYDRAGLGRSDRDPARRTAGRMVDDLRALLDRAAVVPPYVLLAHSWGGLVARLFAARHPDEVAGSVLIDSAHEDAFSAPLLAMNRVSYSVLWVLAQVGALPSILRKQGVMKGFSPDEEREVIATVRRDARAAWREVAGIAASLREMTDARATSSRPRPPVVALSANGAKKDSGYVAKTYEKMHALHGAWVDDARGGYHLVAPKGVGHYMHLDAAHLVLDAVDHVLQIATR